MRRVKAVSLSAELDTIQRTVEGAALLVEVGRAGGVEDEDIGALVSAILALAVCRLRDLGRAGRGALDPGVLLAPHNTVVDEAAEDIVLGPKSSTSKQKRPRRGAR